MIRKILSVLLTLTVLFSLPWTAVSAASEQKEKPRVIHVVYDDSTSMYRYFYTDGSREYYDKWCHARYSLEVFSALMGEEDIMTVYPVNRWGKPALTIKGSDPPQERVDAIRNMADKTGGTPYTAVEKAAEAFSSYGEDVEKWLVVLTDGDFSVVDPQNYTVEKPSAEIDADIARFAADGISVAWLAIGEDLRYLPVQRTDDGVYVWQADSSDSILRSLTAVSNTVFERQQLPADYLRLTADTLTITPDVPMEQLVIFAQGEDVSLKSEGGALRPLQSTSVRYNDRIPDALWEERDLIPVDRDLSGLLTDFRSAGDTPIPAGEYTFSAKGIRSVQVYYKPSVSLGILLTQDGKPLDGDPVEGEVQAELFLQDPVTGERLDSAILKDVRFTGTLNQNGTPFDWTGANTVLTLQPGCAELALRAELPGYNYVRSTFSFDVQHDLGGLVIRAEPRTDLSAADLPVTDAVTYSFFKVDPDTGAEIPLTDSELSTLSFLAERADTDQKKQISIRYGMLDDHIILCLDHALNSRGDPDPLATFTGTLRIRAEASFESGGQKGSGEVYTDIVIAEAPFTARLGWFWDKWKWIIIALIALLLLDLYLYIAYGSTAKFLRGRKGLGSAPQMMITADPGTIRAKTSPDPVQTCSIQLDPFYQHKAFHAQRANVVIGCRGMEHFRFQVEAVCEDGKYRMKPIGLVEQLSQPIYKNVTIDGIELTNLRQGRTFGYHMRIHYRKALGRKVEDYDVQL